MIVPSTRLASVYWEETEPGGAATAAAGRVTAALGNIPPFAHKAGSISCAVRVGEKRNHFIEINACTLHFVKALEGVLLNTLLTSLLEILQELRRRYVPVSPWSDTPANDIIFIVIGQESWSTDRLFTFVILPRNFSYSWSSPQRNEALFSATLLISESGSTDLAEKLLFPDTPTISEIRNRIYYN